MSAKQLNRLINLLEQAKPQNAPRRQRRRRKNPANGSNVVTAPAVGGAVMRSRVPRVLTRGDGIMVRNTERFITITASAGGLTAFSRSDCIPAGMPWLSNVAANYSKYRWISLQLYYIPAVPTSSTGTVAAGLVYDVNDSAAGTTVAFVQQLYHAVSGPIWAGYEGATGLNSNGRAVPNGAMCMVVDVDRMDKPYYKYVTATQLSGMSGAESSMYIPVSVLWATDGNQAAVGITCGHIVAKYEIELLEPVPASLND